MAGSDLSVINDILKEDYRGPLRNQLNNAVVTSAQLDKNTTDFSGKYAVVPIRYGRNAGVGARKEREVMPAPGNPLTTVAHVQVKYLYGSIGFTRQAVEAAAKDRGAFVRTQRDNMDDLKDAISRDYARQVWGDGTGVLAVCGTTTASTTLQLAADTPEQVLVGLISGTRIDIGTVASPQLIASDRFIEAVDFDLKTVDISGAVVTTSSTHRIFRQGNGGTGANQRELTGLQMAATAAGVLHGIDPADVWAWEAFIDENGGTLRAPGENMMERIEYRARVRSGKRIDAWVAEGGVYRYLAEQLKTRVRNVDKMELKGGHTALSFTFGMQEKPLIEDFDAPSGELWGLRWGAIQTYVETDWEWEDELGSGNVLRLSPSRTHEYEANFFSFRDLGYSERNTIIRIQDLETL